jgi:hypothetical protein
MNAQVTIGANRVPATGAVLDLDSSEGVLLLPRYAAEANFLAATAELKGALAYSNANDSIYSCTGTAWVGFGAGKETPKAPETLHIVQLTAAPALTANVTRTLSFAVPPEVVWEKCFATTWISGSSILIWANLVLFSRGAINVRSATDLAANAWSPRIFCWY